MLHVLLDTRHHVINFRNKTNYVKIYWLISHLVSAQILYLLNCSAYVMNYQTIMSKCYVCTG